MSKYKTAAHRKAYHSYSALLGRFSTGTVFLYLWSVSIIGVTFKQIRGPYDVGIFEITTLLFTIIALLTGATQIQKLPIRYLSYVTALFAALMMGGVWALLFHPLRLSVREVTAYCLAFTIMIAFILNARDRTELAIRTFGNAIGIYLIIVVIIAIVPNFFQSRMWYSEIRLQGLSTNPNQIAFLAVAGLSLISANELLGSRFGVTAFLSSAGCSLAGVMSKSSAFTCAIIFAAGMVVTHILYFILTSRTNDATSQKNFRIPKCAPRGFVIAAAVLGVCAIIPRISPLSDNIETQTVRSDKLQDMPPEMSQSEISCRMQAAEQTTVTGTPMIALCHLLHSDQDQGGLRLRIWVDALDLAKHSPIVGYGPGLHVRVPVNGSNALQEAHNTFLDILVISGGVGLSAFLGFIIGIFYRAFKNDKLYTAAMLWLPMAAFMSFHYVGRQPLFWILLLLAWQVSGRCQSYECSEHQHIN